MERKPQEHQTTRERPTDLVELITPLGEMKMPAEREEVGRIEFVNRSEAKQAGELCKLLVNVLSNLIL